MKKCVSVFISIVIVMLVFAFSLIIVACAEGYDFDNMTNEELQELIDCASAELNSREQSTQNANGFTGNGIKWGMSREEVQNTLGETAGGSAGSSIDVSELYYWDVDIEKNKADLTYTFLDDSLVMTTYILNTRKTTAAKLALKMCAEFGESTNKDPQVTEDLFNKIYETTVDTLEDRKSVV